ncbi:MAG: hypothetical protein WD059_01730 [Balneolaceae bacterium]
MRKLLLLVSFSVCFNAQYVLAQTEEPESEPPPTIQPEKGDIGLGFDAVPFLEYLGNIFNGTQNNSVGAAFPGNSQQIFVKFHLSDDAAIRSRFRTDYDRVTNRNRVILDNQPIPDPSVEVTDEWITSPTDIRIGGGLEFRKGSEKIVGVFGGEASFIYSQQVISYEYGNPITEQNQSPTSTFSQINAGRFERLTEQRQNKQLGAGFNAFIGVEYFFAPKISLGAEFTLGVDFMKAYRSQNTYEFWDAASSSIQNRTTISEGGNSLAVDTGNYGGSINLMFYF